MDSSFIQCREENEYPRRIAGLLADVHRRLEVPTIVATNVLVMAEDLGPFLLSSKVCVLGAAAPLRSACARASKIVRGLAQYGTS